LIDWRAATVEALRSVGDAIYRRLVSQWKRSCEGPADQRRLLW
jgi:hypothetical protein